MIAESLSNDRKNEHLYRDNTGLLLFGDAGTGKSFFVGCIVNALVKDDKEKLHVFDENGLYLATKKIL